MILSLLAGLLFGSVGYYSVLTWSSASLAFFLVSASCIIGKILQNTRFGSNNISSLFFAPIYQLLFYILFLAVLQNPVETAIKNSKTSVVILYCRGFFFSLSSWKSDNYHIPKQRSHTTVPIVEPLLQVRALKCAIVSHVDDAAGGAFQRPGGASASGQGRLRALLLIAVFQPVFMWWLTRHLIVWGVTVQRTRCVTWLSEVSRSSEHGASPDRLWRHGPANTVQRTRCATQPTVASRSSKHCASPDRLRRRVPANMALPLIDGGHLTIRDDTIQRICHPIVTTWSSKHAASPLCDIIKLRVHNTYQVYW